MAAKTINSADGRKGTDASAISDILSARNDLFKYHPLLAQSTTVLCTPPIEELLPILRGVILLRQQGTYLVGPSSIGKTKALEFVAATLREELPGLCILNHIPQNKQVMSVRAFFMHFLKSVGHKNFKGETYVLRTRVLNAIVDQGRRNGWNLAVAFIDEAQTMQLEDFQFLKDIVNESEEHDVVFLPILMGQDPDFDRTREMLLDAGRFDLISRFVLKRIEFRGFNSKDDIKALLHEIDSQTYPAEKGWSWTQFFVPIAYSNGFRMEDCAALLYKRLRDLVPGRLKKNRIFPARQLFAAIRTFLKKAAAVDAKELPELETLWTYAIEEAMLEEAIELVSFASKKGGVSVQI